MEWSPIIKNPIDLPLLQLEMYRAIDRSYRYEDDASIQITDVFGEMYLALINAYLEADGADPSTERGTNHYAAQVAVDIIDSLQNGGSYFVADEMTTMLHRVAKNVPSDFSLHPRMFPQGKGFLYLEEPLIFGDSAVVGWAWQVVWLKTAQLFEASERMHEEEGDTDNETFLQAIIRLMDEGLVVRGSGENEEIAGISLCFWTDPHHEDDHYYADEEKAKGNVYFGLRQFPWVPAPMAFTWIPCGVPIDSDHIYGSLPMAYQPEVIREHRPGTVPSTKQVAYSYGRRVDFATPTEAAPLWKFLVATHEMLNSRIVEHAGLNRSQQRQLHRAKFDQEFKIIRLRKVVRVGGRGDEDDDDEYKIDYQYMVPPHWQRYHTNEGIIWKMRDWYRAGPEDAPMLDREVVYQLDR